MYTFTNKLRNFSTILMLIGFLGLTYGFLTAPNTIEQANAMVADPNHGDGHGHISGANVHQTEEYKKDTPHNDSKESYHNGGHEEAHNNHSHGDDHHGEHLLHQLQNKPWAALYVAAFSL